jgi:hypothetical protein
MERLPFLGRDLCQWQPQHFHDGLQGADRAEEAAATDGPVAGPHVDFLDEYVVDRHEAEHLGDLVGIEPPLTRADFIDGQVADGDSDAIALGLDEGQRAVQTRVDAGDDHVRRPST